jgi:decaprenylphospho-beta-D-ribofuranose 2-oxidase
MTIISGWGRYPIVETDLLTPRTPEAARITTSRIMGGIARGNGRAYGDAGIGDRQTMQMGALNRIRAFDTETGLLTAEAGMLLVDVIALLLPRGFFPAVVPGTKYVTIGGAIAADVHGKNHHRDGGFGDHVEGLLLATSDGSLVRASRQENPDIFAATIGGMGLTGTIIEATLRLRTVETSWILQRTIVASNLAAAIAALEEGDRATYSVAWIDCVATGTALGRSLIFLGEHALRTDLSGEAAVNPFPPIGGVGLSVPFDFPAIALNRLTVGTFNSLYFHRAARRAGTPFLVPADPFFFRSTALELGIESTGRGVSFSTSVSSPPPWHPRFSPKCSSGLPFAAMPSF